MPRRARMYLPGLPYHVVQRGNNRQTCFITPGSYLFYLELWQEVSRRYGVAVHAYCLMGNHIHFLATPASDTALSDTLKVVGSRYAQYVNRTYRRTGTLWEGRHRSSLVQSERYLFSCMRYIELNPVRAGMVTRPEQYRWSSHRANAWGETGWISPHPEYLRLGETQERRCRAYRKLFHDPLNERELRAIRKAAHYSQPVGDERFRRCIEQQHGISLGQMRRGRPPVRKKGDGGNII